MITGGRASSTEAEQARLESVQSAAAAGPSGIAQLLEMTSDPSWVVRRAVIDALARAGAEAIGPLCEALVSRRDDENRVAAIVDALATSGAAADPAVAELARSANPAVAADAAHVLGRRRTAMVHVLADLVGHPDDNVSLAAIEALGRVGGRAAVDALVQVVQGSNFFRKFPAIDVLGRSGDPRAVAPLAALLDDSPYAPEAARALGRTGTRGAVKPLVLLLAARGDSQVRVAAVGLADLRRRHFEETGSAAPIDSTVRELAAGLPVARRLTQTLAGADEQEKIAICTVLGICGAVDAAAKLGDLLDAAPRVAEAAAEALRRLGADSDAYLIEALERGDSRQRIALLPLATRSRLGEPVTECLSDADPDVRAAACEALGRIADPDAVRALFPLLGDPSAQVAMAALAAIQGLGGLETEALALSAARSSSPPVRRAALRILAYFGYSSALEIFLAAVEDPDPKIVDAAIQGLPMLEDPRALEGLIGAAHSLSARTRASAMRALGQCSGDVRVASALIKALIDADAWVRYFACQALGRIHCDAAARLIEPLLEDPAGQVRVAAVEALSHLSSKTATDALVRAVELEDPDVRRAALVGLGIAKHPESLPILLRAAASSDSATRLVAISGVASFESPDAVMALELAAQDSDEAVRAASVGLLASRRGISATATLIRLLGSSAPQERVQAALSLPVDGRIRGLSIALETANDETAPRLTSALARMHRRDATEALIAALGFANPCARKAAATTLASVGTAPALSAVQRAATADPDPAVREICSIVLAS